MNWLQFTASNVLLLTQVEGSGPEINSLLLEHRHILPAFKHSEDAYSPAKVLAAEIPFQPGFQELQLSNAFSFELLCANYIWEASGVSRRMNIEVAIACGNTVGWIARWLVSKEEVKKLLERPSFIMANFNHLATLPIKGEDGVKLVAESIMVEEEKVLVRFIPGSEL
ncbi:uncharacterized protein EV420DRAFT_1476154 [Desarmillaria tabescens]|uniref:Uncharacterized protein n=1 Tax=Armillaria tabescens TaxID=1929756 RepID=A0AA39NFM7_ARMTA|nr:uncharacterized protein EV420DRAFT_1476154 [Desarmillaria tabescens]KAK0464762.1 hypothetical protein EV420DRAFT_1476154 [Desarmillaria tabescens]